MSIDAACPASNSVHPPNELNATSTSNRLISVLEDPVNYNVKHPLQYGWSLWLKKADAKPAPAANNDSSTASSAPKSSMEIWRDSVENLGGNIRTVEDFWCVFNNIPTVGQLPPGSDYFFFKDGIVPAWEDPHHVGGGQFTVALASGGRDRDGPKGGAPKSSADWEALWLNAMLACVACMPEKHVNLTGVNFGRRPRGDRIQIWFAPTDPDVIRSLEQDIGKALSSGGAPGFTLKFSAFTSHGGGSGGGGSHGGAGGGGARRESSGMRRDSRPSGHHH